ncbi:MAG: HAD family hydrolase [Actinomycetota bacterium]|nr:HAD family hydrolase [Actinomycetota bacterium]
MPAGDAGVLFDVDGTLVDTAYLHTVCWSEALRQVGRTVAMNHIHRGIGMGSAELLDHLLGAQRSHDQDETVKASHLALYKQHWGRLQKLPGAVELLRRCRHSNLAVVLASSASDEELSALRSALDADDLITASTSSGDADSAKPAPDILHAALERSGLDPERTVFVGDSVWDGAASARAGLTFIGLTCGGTSLAELTHAGAVEVWQDPADLLAHFADSAIGAAT